MRRGEGIRYKRGERILKGVSLLIHRRSVVAVIGPNGSGKSTLGMVMAGLWRPHKGFVEADGEDPLGKVYVAFQDGRLLDLSVKEYLELVGEIDLLPRLGVNKVLDKKCKRLSLGRKKRVHLQAAFSSRHPYVVLDEPESGIDSLRDVKLTIEELRRRKGVLLITHEPSLMRLADKVFRLFNGKLQKYEEDSEGKDVIREGDTLSDTVYRGAVFRGFRAISGTGLP